MEARTTEELLAAIRNAAWMVRHYQLQRGEYGKIRRAQAILVLGHLVRDGFSRSEDYESLLGAVVDGLRPKDSQPF